MTRYRIVCTNQEPAGASHDAAHITIVGTGEDPDGANGKWGVDEVRTKIDNGDTFYTQSSTTGKTAEVEKYDCGCGYGTIRTNPDDQIDNNLDDLRECNWK